MAASSKTRDYSRVESIFFESSRVESGFFNSKLELKSSRVSSLESSSAWTSRVEFELDLDSTRTQLDSTRKTRPELCIGTVTYVCGFLDVGSDIIRYTDS